MAKADTRAGRHSDRLDEPVVTPAAQAEAAPKLIVKIAEGVHARIDGKLVEPGDTCELEIPLATNLVLLKHGTIIGTAE